MNSRPGSSTRDLKLRKHPLQASVRSGALHEHSEVPLLSSMRSHRRDAIAFASIAIEPLVLRGKRPSAYLPRSWRRGASLGMGIPGDMVTACPRGCLKAVKIE